EVAGHGQRVQLSGEFTQLWPAREEGKMVPFLRKETGASSAHTLARGRHNSYWCRGHEWSRHQRDSQLNTGSIAVRTTAKRKTDTAKANATTRTRRCLNLLEAFAKKSTAANNTVLARY